MTNGLNTSQFPPPNYRPPSPIVMTALSPPYKAPEMMSTPRKGMTDPVLSQVLKLIYFFSGKIEICDIIWYARRCTYGE